MFRERTAARTCKSYFVSRSKIRNLGAESKGKASRNCWTIHRLVGCLVTLKCKMRRRSWLIMKKQYLCRARHKYWHAALPLMPTPYWSQRLGGTNGVQSRHNSEALQETQACRSPKARPTLQSTRYGGAS